MKTKLNVSVNRQNVTDENGNVLRSMFFLKIGCNTVLEEVSINVGEKTYNAVKELLEEEQLQNNETTEKALKEVGLNKNNQKGK